MSDPEEVTIVVHGAKGLQGKKAGRHKYSVIFGLGGSKYRTAVVKEPNGNPVWNEETKVHVTNVLDQVFIIVTEKDDILGHITIPLTSLGGVKGQCKVAPLQAHKRCSKPQGFVSYQCYVSKYRTLIDDSLNFISNSPRVSENARPRSAFQRLRKRMASSSTKKKEEHKEHKVSLSNLNKRISKSVHDLFSFSPFSSKDNVETDNVSTSSQKNGTYRNKNKKRFSLSFLSMSSDLDKTGTRIIITDCIPNSGPIDQPTRLTIEGRNLATGKSDILLLKVAGCDCTDTLEFESSNRIYCTTHYYKMCKGPIEIDTLSSGKGILKDGFSFYEGLDDTDNSILNPFDNFSDSAVQNGSLKDCMRNEIKSGTDTVPRVENTPSTPTGKSPITSTPYNQQTANSRRPSVATPGFDSVPKRENTSSTPMGKPSITSTPYHQQTANSRRQSVATTEASYQSAKIPIEHVSKEELQAKIDLLEKEKTALKKNNEEMKMYIDKLVTKCIEYCPEALAQEEDEKTKLYVLI